MGHSYIHPDRLSYHSIQARCYSTKFAPPKKETKDKNLSSGIKRFLAQKEEEEREKARQLRESRERLESMRDNKSKNKINKMLKVIKSANKSQISDESNPTKVDSPQPLQPDEDDYGYVSQESSVLYKKLMEKYKTSPEENKSGTLRPTGPVATKRQPTSVSVGKSSSTSSKAPSKSSQPTPGQRRPDSSIKVGGNNKNIVNGKAQPAATKNNNTNKPRRPPPPVVNFEALLKLAEKKQFEPVKVEKDSTDSSRKDDRPMSAKEKREHEERMRMVEARKRRLENDNYDYRKDANGTKGNSNNNNKRPESSAPLNNPGHASAVKRTGGIRPVTATATSSNNNTSNKRPPQPPKATATSSSNGHSNNRMSVPQNKTTTPAAVPTKTRQFPPPDVQRTRSFPPEDVVRRPANASRPFPPADVRRKPQPGPSYGNARDNYKREFLFYKLSNLSSTTLIRNLKFDKLQFDDNFRPTNAGGRGAGLRRLR